MFSSRERQPDNQDLSSLLDLSFKVHCQHIPHASVQCDTVSRDADILAWPPQENTVEYRCEKCEATTATACARFSSLPRLLILHLKRLHLGCKSSAPIKFNEELDLSKHAPLLQHLHLKFVNAGNAYPDLKLESSE